MLAQVQENSCDIGHEDPQHQRIFSVENLSGLFFLICAVQHHACSRSNGRSNDFTQDYSMHVSPILSASCEILGDFDRFVLGGLGACAASAKTMGHVCAFQMISLHCQFFSCQNENS